uniref:Proteasome 20S subunit beta 1 n=1 Tax=Felis catus TaxID=9685 RepID=A0ABI7YVY6_FELCA
CFLRKETFLRKTTKNLSRLLGIGGARLPTGATNERREIERPELAPREAGSGGTSGWAPSRRETAAVGAARCCRRPRGAGDPAETWRWSPTAPPALWRCAFRPTLSTEGKGAVYSFDPVGSYQRDSFKAGGSASAMLQPLLDNQVGFKNMQNVEHVPLSLDRAMRLVKDVFISAAERDVYTGDALKICIVTKEGIREETVPLRKD